MIDRDDAGCRVLHIEVPVLSAYCALDSYNQRDWHLSIRAVLEGPALAAQAGLLDLIVEGGGSILFVAPCSDGDGAWTVALAGLHGLARSIAKEYGRFNIRCNVLIGHSPELERMLAINTAITGEIIVVESEEICTL